MNRIIEICDKIIELNKENVRYEEKGLFEREAYTLNHAAKLARALKRSIEQLEYIACVNTESTASGHAHLTLKEIEEIFK